MFNILSAFFRPKPLENTQTTLPEQVPGEQLVLGGGMLHQSLSYQLHRNLSNQIRTYRAASSYVEVADAIDEIVEACVVSRQDYEFDDFKSVRPLLKGPINKSLQKEVDEVWNGLYSRLKLSSALPDLFRTWYIDGRVYVHKIKTDKHIVKLLNIDSINISRIKIVELDQSNDYTGLIKINTNQDNSDIVYIYDNSSNYNKFFPGTFTRIAVMSDDIIYADSGLIDQENNIVSYLDRSIIPYHTVRQMETALAVYRLARAPVRNAFYVDVGSLTGKKAEEFLNAQMAKFKTEITYNQATGEINDNKKGLSIVDDYWLPRSDGSNATSVEPIQTGASNVTIDDVQFEHSRFIKSLGVPSARLIDDQNPFNDGEDITYAEHKFNKRVFKLRSRFANMFLEDLLVSELKLLGIVSEPDEISEFIESLHWIWEDDNMYEEQRRLSKLEKQIEVLSAGKELVDFAYSQSELLQKVLNISQDEADELIKKMPKQPEEPSE
jgi:hypothetical protein